MHLMKEMDILTAQGYGRGLQFMTGLVIGMTMGGSVGGVPGMLVGGAMGGMLFAMGSP